MNIDWEEEIKISWFTDNMIVSVENLKEFAATEK